MKPGKVYLIGAGPGDPELMTLKAVRLLGEAQVVLLDALVNREVLRFVAPGAQVVEVGKRGGRHSATQEEIQQQMLEHALTGKTVARLKGGDPFMFGRGGEEVQCLQAAGVEVEVVSGITSGMAVPAALGIPVTHRDHARSVTFLTGHGCNDTPPNWAGLVAAGGTLVIYMGVANLPGITEQLLAAGMPPSRPAAVIQNGTLPQQRCVAAPLGQLAERVRLSGIGSPAIVIIGDVVGVAAQLQSQLTSQLKRQAPLQEQFEEQFV
ncbi:uroporphyrinogen-III C-methyltransferase [Rugamonas sp. DEMB1]|uniref:uroporphyrinogen-III C-methyltransferase n=1 Tax=Rugamonas sp. DEMB1 TaxID=3039386 RepID=UPI00244D362E|nr:uroporphyrinogen-III C-methyltransferase [Rugamonas sp. DEMB1]WGG48222.1 uroporphyrinogen-III C-methyltransferase [Rugamonas sp. DEMB1]